MTSARSGRRAMVVDALAASGVGLVVLGPAFLSSGYLLRGDMVFTPDMPWKDAWLGLGGSTPRSAPMDALVWAGGTVLPGWVVQRLLLFVPLVLGGIGLGRLLREEHVVARVAAITLFWWNPWVAERLSIGQWTILAGHALLPWAALAAHRLRTDGRRQWPMVLAVAMLAGICGPPTLLMVGVCLLVVAAGSGRAGWVVVSSSLIASLPWLVPSLLVAGLDGVGEGSPFAAFAARAESGAGLLASLLSFGGIWKESVWPPERTSSLLVVCSATLTIAALVGLRWVRVPAGVPRRLLVVGGVGLLLAALPAVPAVTAALDAATGVLPPLAVLRDSHRFVGLAVLTASVGLAGLARRARDGAGPGREALRVVAPALVLAPVVLLPSLGGGLGGALSAVDYPSEWHAVRDRLEAAGPGRTVVLPWRGGYRGYAWNDHRAVLDPAPRFFPGEVLVDDTVVLPGSDIPPEDAHLAAVRSALTTGATSSTAMADALRGAGVRWVLAEVDNAPGPLPAGDVVHSGELLTLVDLGVPTGARGTAERPERSAAELLVLGLDALWLMAAAAAILSVGARRRSARL